MTRRTSTLPTRAGHTPPVQASALIVGFGHLMWMWMVWAVATVVYAVIVILVANGNGADDSIWQQAVASWQRWIMIGAGVVTGTTFFRYIVTHGVPRPLFAAGATIGLAAVSVASGLFVTAGFAIESFVYDRLDWPQVLRDGDMLAGVADIARFAPEMVLLLAAYATTGWLIGACFYRFGAEAGIPLIVPAAIPGLVAEVLLDADVAGLGPIRPDSDVALPVAVPLLLAVLAVAVVAVHRLIRTTPVR